MLSTLLFLPLLIAMQAVPPNPPPEPGIYTNEEQVYFEREAGRTPPAWVGIRVERQGNQVVAQPIDAFGAVSGTAMPSPPVFDQGEDRSSFSTSIGGSTVRLNRARPFTCWVSVRRHADRANGEADWSFDRNLSLHDQGGRLLVQPEGGPPVVVRMRNVVWPPPSTNRPSLVLYVHRPESPDRAESYSWADPDARMVGINLRWMQASCSRS
jgi:hypothetical protein